jgi:uncharacterized membrane protein YedE/YeeE
MFESTDQLLLGLLTGITFGFLLQKGRVAKYEKIIGQLLLKDWTVFKIMTTAIVIGAAGVYTLVSLGAARLDIWPFQVAAVLLGAVLFGAGLAVIGYCPGTGLAASGEGSRDAMVGVLGMITGAGIYVAAYDWLEPVGLALGDYGKVTVPDALGVPPWLVIVVLAVVVTIVLWIIERHERREAQRPTFRNRVDQRTASWHWPSGADRPIAGGS